MPDDSSQETQTPRAADDESGLPDSPGHAPGGGRVTQRIPFGRLALEFVVIVVGGLLLAGLVVGGSWGDWPNGGAIVPFSILPLLGAGGGVASLLVARKAGRALRSGEETGSLLEG